MVTFKTSDDYQVKVSVEIARMCGVVRDFFDGDVDCPEVENADPIPLLNVRGEIFTKIVLTSEKLHKLRSIYEAVEKERQELEANFFGELSDKKIVDLVKAEDYVLDFVGDACKKFLEVRSKRIAVEKKRQEFDVEFFSQHSDAMIIELVREADYLEIEELLDFVMPSFRKRFGLGDDKGVEFVYTAEAEEILHRSAAWASEGASS